MTNADREKEIDAIKHALARWLDSQNAPRKETIVAMLNVVGAMIGSMSSNEESLEEGIEIFCNLLEQYIRIGFAIDNAD